MHWLEAPLHRIALSARIYCSQFLSLKEFGIWKKPFPPVVMPFDMYATKKRNKLDLFVYLILSHRPTPIIALYVACLLTFKDGHCQKHSDQMCKRSQDCFSRVREVDR